MGELQALSVPSGTITWTLTDLLSSWQDRFCAMFGTRLSLLATSPPALLTTTAHGMARIFITVGGAVDMIRDPYNDAPVADRPRAEIVMLWGTQSCSLEQPTEGGKPAFGASSLMAVRRCFVSAGAPAGRAGSHRRPCLCKSHECRQTMAMIARAAVATRLLNAGLSLAEIANRIGWSVSYATKVIEKYACASPEETDAVLVKLAQGKASVART